MSQPNKFKSIQAAVHNLIKAQNLNGFFASKLYIEIGKGWIEKQMKIIFERCLRLQMFKATDREMQRKTVIAISMT